jgi:hypothetical protein
MNLTRCLSLFLASLALAAATGGTKADTGSDTPPRGGSLRGKVLKEELLSRHYGEQERNLKNKREDFRDTDWEDFYSAIIISKAVYFEDTNNGKNLECEIVRSDLGQDEDHLCLAREVGLNAATIYQDKQTCFVAFRGTRTPNSNDDQNIDSFRYDTESNFIHDVVYEEDCQYTRGFRDAYEDMKSFLKNNLPVCKSICSPGPCSVVLTGHSQGGAAAVAASFDRDPEMLDLFDDPKVITFGAPAVALTESECNSIINEEKHIRIVTANMDERELKCDPIPEHGRKEIILDIPDGVFGLDEHELSIIESSDKEQTFHLGNTVFLMRDGDTRFGVFSYEFAYAFGDATCHNYGPRNIQVLRNADFVDKKDGDDFFGFVAASRILNNPPHHVDSYLWALKTIVRDGATAGLTENHVCTQDWQCEGEMICDDVFSDDDSNECGFPRVISSGYSTNDNGGTPADGSLGRCEGDCDSDIECGDGLRCFERDGGELVPGCLGTPRQGWDYCIRENEVISTGYSTDNNGGSPEPGSLLRCEGDCQSDSECGDGLKCFQRDGGELVPGCLGTPTQGWDYCILENEVVSSGYSTNANGGTPADGSLGLCEGDCDKDIECRNGLRCFQRDGGELVPGCLGRPTQGWDYCIREEDMP